ncbi:hypothetical protein EG328_006605 [Venturia inaequalis]|uniref:C2H2-type domain-containing protein n=1 Tax=Venturia inaequalis TaxID=5025 RepID=A0A8H3YQX4_VENIN|nr:hypothetical protein EG328_006605 [Venturia inaequalis]RDI88235.1 hypothetical protein Vi05172_g1995 [Venturia inaequalis]
MSEHDVSQLERAPDSLRSAVDPTLQEVLLQAQHSQLSEQMHHQDYPDPSSGIQHGHVQEIMHSDHLHHSDQHDLADDMSSPDRQEPFSPRRGYTHKRSEEPQRNDQGKMICKFQSSCAHLTFERRCEWSKHMDKHDRPYKCQEPGCEKLQGFTYSGGLLRHQREVHKMHGGTKKALYCPVETCKRHSGSGFTRKENLSEHMRRVHRSTSDGADMNGHDANLLQAVATEARTLEELTSDGERSTKRRRMGTLDEFASGEPEAVAKLRQENEDLKKRMKQMEKDLHQQRTLLQDIITRQQPPTPTGPMT